MLKWALIFFAIFALQVVPQAMPPIGCVRSRLLELIDVTFSKRANGGS